jgi:endo-1,4-beta-xylanase
MSKLSSLALLAAVASPALAQPAVSLLTDLSGYAKTGTINLKSTLAAVSTRKGASFHFGSTYDTYDSDASFLQSVFSTFFNHLVAENGCKWDATEPSRGTSSLTSCQGAQSFAASSGISFRGHNTFWHSQTPVCFHFLTLFLEASNCRRHSLGFPEASPVAILPQTSFLNMSSKRSRVWVHHSLRGT